MTNAPPQIVVSLPARTVVEARQQIGEATRGGADLIEIRLDRFSAGELERATGLFPSPRPLIATLRSRAEGGEGPDDPVSRLRILETMSRLPFRWIDAERDRDFPAAESLAGSEDRGLIVSTHRATPVPGSEWVRLVREDVPEGAVRKVVVPATVGQLLGELIPSLPPPEGARLVTHTTGGSGPLLRAWAKRLGLAFAYASLPEMPSPSAPRTVEPSQIPVDRLRAFLDSEDPAPLFAVVGHPVGHSRSPALHSRWMQDSGQVGLYVALDFEDEREFVESVPSLFESGFRGLNVTYPFKQAAVQLANQVGAGAAAVGVANALTVVPGGVEAENTDLAAALRRLQELRASGNWDGVSLGVLGAGGSARATLAAARQLGVESHVWARRPEASAELGRAFDAHAVPGALSARPTLVVHATPVGRPSQDPSLLPDLDPWLRPGVPLLDWVYAPDDPFLRTAAEKRGATYEDGWRLLVYQAAVSFGIWWGDEPSPEQVEAVVEGKSP